MITLVERQFPQYATTQMVICFRDLGMYVLVQAEDGLLLVRCAGRGDPLVLHNTVSLNIRQVYNINKYNMIYIYITAFWVCLKMG